jgi:uncharacterized membrane protein (DUF4010 family)
VLTRLTGSLPLEAIKIALVLSLSFLIGLEREERHAVERTGRVNFGGVRTFPLIGLVGYALALLSGSSLMPVTVGFAVVAAFLLVSYQHKLQTIESAGATTEVSALMTYLIGALVSHGEFWIATTLAILSVLLLELKEMLESFSERLPGTEILAFTKFLLLTGVILPVLPNQTFGSFGFNPFKTWLIVVAASGISYGSYLLQKLGKTHGVLLSAVLGGLYSSTATTVILAKRARQQNMPNLYAGSILMAAGVMYLRLLLLVGLFNHDLLKRLALGFVILGGAALVSGWLWSRRQKAGDEGGEKKDVEIKNPLELSAAFLFALLFVVLLAATHYAILYFGRRGVYVLAALTGFTDIDPFVLGLTQARGAATPTGLAASAIVVAAAANNVAKGAYAFCFADRTTGRLALALLLALAVLGLVPLAFL